jgi:site-specific DNA recombinase
VSGRYLAAVPDSPRRVVLYVRVSSVMGRGGDEFHSPDMQLNAMHRATAGMQEVAVIDDDIDQTGRTFEREGIAKIRKLAELGSFDVLAVYNISRFGRNVLESLKFLNWLADRGVTILSASEHIDTSTPSGRWMLTNMLAIAEMRSDEIGVEWSRTISSRARNGMHHGPPPTGYVKGDDGRLVPDPIAGAAVRQAFADYAAGLPVVGIRRRLHAATGLGFAPSTFKSMLSNVAYAGTVRVGARGPAGVVEFPGAHPPLVDRDTWVKVQARVARDRSVPAKYAAPQYPLSGLGRCGSCEKATNYRNDAGKGAVRIFCPRTWNTAGDGCRGCGALPAADVEAWVLNRVRVHVSALRGDIGTQSAQLARASRAGVDAGAVETERAATRRAMARATERWSREQIDDRSYQDAMTSLRAAEAELSVTLARLQETAAAPEPGKLIALGEKLLELWPRMDGEQRNRALRDLATSVMIAPATYRRQPASERVTVQWR